MIPYTLTWFRHRVTDKSPSHICHTIRHTYKFLFINKFKLAVTDVTDFYRKTSLLLPTKKSSCSFPKRPLSFLKSSWSFIIKSLVFILFVWAFSYFWQQELTGVTDSVTDRWRTFYLSQHTDKKVLCQSSLEVRLKSSQQTVSNYIPKSKAYSGIESSTGWNSLFHQYGIIYSTVRNYLFQPDKTICSALMEQVIPLRKAICS